MSSTFGPADLAPEFIDQNGDATIPRPASAVLTLLESAGLFALGVFVMAFMSHYSAAPGKEVGLPGHDAFYHTRMASMIPDYLKLKEFPWLQHVYWSADPERLPPVLRWLAWTRPRDVANPFVSHHYGFHVLIAPFVKAGEQLYRAEPGGELAGGMAGARWAVWTFFGLNLVVFNLLLRAGNVPYRWFWLILFLFLPDQFFFRHAYARAIGSSFIVMQLQLLMLIRRRTILAGIVTFFYVHVYLGGVIFAMLTVLIYVGVCVFSPREDRSVPWKMLLSTTIGWAAGILTYPYWGVLQFLFLQVFGSGLTPTVQVGGEWSPYSDTWWFIRSAWPILVLWFAAIPVRLRFGPKLTARELTVFLVSLAFFVLTMKAKRFIEYWPPLALLSAAYLLGPPLARFTNYVRQRYEEEGGNALEGVRAVALLLFAGVAAGLLIYLSGRSDARQILGEWRMLSAIFALLMLAPLVRAWLRGASLGVRREWSFPVLISASGLLVGSAIFAFTRLSYARTGKGVEFPEARFDFDAKVWTIVALLYVLTPLALFLFYRRKPQGTAGNVPVGSPLLRLGTVLAVGLATFGAALAAQPNRLLHLASQTRCQYDLPEVRKLMDFMKANTNAGDLVFTDDWDVFPVYFFHNTHNHYIVGLDPEFTNQRNPTLWERYVRVSRGEVPQESRVVLQRTPKLITESIRVELSDIRTHFRAQYVIADADHPALRSKLARAPEFAELIYPCRDYDRCRNAPYMVFRIFEIDRKLPPPQPDAQGRLFLSQLRAVEQRQAWGALGLDQSVDGRTMRIGGQSFWRGLGTHAYSRLTYEIPPGYDTFEALAGIDAETEGAGSVIAAVLLDDRRVFETPVLTGESAAVPIRIDLKGARRITLVGETTPDGQQFDHLDWAEARFVRGQGAASKLAPTTAPASTAPPSTAPATTAPAGAPPGPPQ